MNLFRPILLVLLLAAASAQAAATRVALVSTCGGKAGEDLLTLAEVKLSTESGIEVLERRKVERVLDEQQLVHCGLSEAVSAVTVGRFLGVDIFGSLETIPNEKEALGLVVYDAHTGAKLGDAMLPSAVWLEQSADAILKSIALGINKRDRQRAGGEVATLSISGIRNATLPRSYDSLCQSIGTLLERRLLDVPNLVVLERRHLEHINQERALLPEADVKELLGSLVTLELEMARGGTNEIRTTVSLKNSKGIEVNRVTASSKTGNAVELADQLTERIAAWMKSKPVDTSSNYPQEAMHFEREARYLESIGDSQAALQAMESAAALDPENDDIGIKLAGYLVRKTQQLARDPSSDLEEVLSMANRSLDVTRTVRERQVEFGFAIENLEREPEDGLCDDALWRSLLGRIHPGEPTEVGWHRFQTGLRNFVVGVVMKGLARRAGEKTYGWAAYTDNIQELLRRMEGLSWTSADWVAGTKQCYEMWLKLSEKFPLSGGWEFESTRLMTRTCCQAKGSATRIAQHFNNWELQPNDLKELRSIFDQMEHHTNQVIQIYGQTGTLMLDIRAKTLAPDEVRRRYWMIRDFNRAACTHQPKDLRNLYFTAVNVIDLAFSDWQEREPEYQDLFEFMMQQKHLSIWVIWNVIESASSPFRQFRSASGGAYGIGVDAFPMETHVRPDYEYPKLVDNANRVLALYRTGRYSDGFGMWCITYGSLPGEMANVMQFIYKKRPDLAPPPPAPPWTEARLIFECNATNRISDLQLPELNGDSICALGRGLDGGFCFVRIPFNGATPQIVPLSIPPNAQPTSFALSSNQLFVGTSSHGIFACLLASGKAVTLTESNGLPANDVHAVAWLNDKLYAGLGGGYLVSYDFKTEHCEVIASGRRREKRTLLDDIMPIFSVISMRADAPRHRLLMLLGTEPSAQCKPMIGLWQMDVSNSSISQLLQLYRPASDLRMDYQGQYWFSFAGWGALNECGGPFRGIIRFDPVADKSHVAAAWRINDRPKSRSAQPGPNLKDEGESVYLPMHAYAPYLIGKEGTWYRLNEMNRLLHEESRNEKLPDLKWRERTYQTTAWRTLDFIGNGSQVVLTATDSVWLLTLPEKSAAKEKP